jgi:hypothetical protein
LADLSDLFKPRDTLATILNDIRATARALESDDAAIHQEPAQGDVQPEPMHPLRGGPRPQLPVPDVPVTEPNEVFVDKTWREIRDIERRAGRSPASK